MTGSSVQSTAPCCTCLGTKLVTSANTRPDKKVGLQWSGRIQGYKDIYLPVTFKCTQKFVLVMFHSYSVLTNGQNITVSCVWKLYINKVKFNNVTISFMQYLPTVSEKQLLRNNSAAGLSIQLWEASSTSLLCHVREAIVEEQLNSKTNRPVRRAQLHLPTVSEKQLLRNNSTARQTVQLGEPSSTSLLCPRSNCWGTTQQQDSASSYERPAPPPYCVMSEKQLLRNNSAASQTIQVFEETQLLWLKCCFTSKETVGLLGAGAQDVHLNFHTAPELWETNSSTSLNLITSGLWGCCCFFGKGCLLQCLVLFALHSRFSAPDARSASVWSTHNRRSSTSTRCGSFLRDSRPLGDIMQALNNLGPVCFSGNEFHWKVIGVISASVVCGTVQKSTRGDGPRNCYGHGGGWVGGMGVGGRVAEGVCVCVWGGGG